MEYIYGIEFKDVLMTIVIGIAISTFLYEKKGILSGGIITPAIIALFMTKIIFVISTIAMIVVLHVIIGQLRKHVILYGRRLYSIVLLLGVGLALSTRIIMDFIHSFGYGMYISDGSSSIVAPWGAFTIPNYLVDLGLGMHYYGYVIGLLMVPIIVNDTQTQGLSKTILALLFVSTLTFAAVLLIP